MKCTRSTAQSVKRSDNDSTTITASTCKARDVDSAAIYLWNTDDGTCSCVLKGGHKSSVAALAFNNAGTLLA